MTEFQSHEAEFDYLKSFEIEEKINQIRWLPPMTPNTHLMLTTNDKTIKMWKVSEKYEKKYTNMNQLNGYPPKSFFHFSLYFSPISTC